MRTRRARRALLVGLLVAAGLVFVAPRARVLWWLHARAEPPVELVVPVAGIETTELIPSFGIRRSEDHVHEGIDIMAPAGTPVLAVADGVVYEDRPNDKGGNVAWILGAGRRLYYFAHMRELAAGIRRGRRVSAGERVGSVGNTGNAIRTPAHLHFEIMEVTGDFLPLEYQEIDPYPELARRGQSRPAPVSGAAPTPPQWSSLPLDPSGALARDAPEIAAKARAVADRVEEALGGLDPFLGSNADADARRLAQLQQLAPRLRARAGELEAEEGAGSLLAEATSTTRALATRVFLATEQADAIQAAWSDCRPRDLGVALSAVQGVSLGLEARSEEAESGLAYFFFEGHRPGVVPPGGGWLVAVGPGLAATRESALVLRVREGGRVVARLPTRPLGSGAVAAWLPAESLSPHAGDCLSLRAEEAGAVGARGVGPELPLCVPQAAPTRYRLLVRLEYDTPARHLSLSPKTLRFRNDACDERLVVAERVVWDDAPEGELIELGEERLVDVNDAEVVCHPEGARIRCKATLPPAVCEGPPEAPPVVVRATEWASAFTPTLSIAEAHYESEGRSDLVDPGVARSLCAHLGRDHASEETHMRFQLVAANGGQRSVFFESPVEALETAREARYDAPPHRIEATFQAGGAERQGEVCVTLVSEACGF